tara:strand:- start:2168 stop:3130 length:963 start_codon:yes stop_codon:yes gene_type:complete
MASKDTRRLNPGIQVKNMFVGPGTKVNPHLVPETSNAQVVSMKGPKLDVSGAAPSLCFAFNTSGALNHETPGDWLSASAIDLDGSNEYLNMSDHNDFDFEYDDTFSLSAWVKTTNTGDETIVSKMGSANSYRGWDFRSSSGRPRFRLQNTANSKAIDVQSDDTDDQLNDSLSHHVVVTYDGSTNASGAKLYIDGNVKSKTTHRDNLGNDTTVNAIDVNVGRADFGNYFDGYISHVSVWNKELTTADITTIYNSGKPGNLSSSMAASSSNLIAWWKCGDGISGSTADSSDSSDSDARIYDMGTGSHHLTPENTEIYDIRKI